jgi:large-conductance mechanosensitive channel
MNILQNEAISFFIIAIVVLMLAFLTKKMEDKSKKDD